MLTSDLKSPEVSETSVASTIEERKRKCIRAGSLVLLCLPNLLHSFKIFSELGIQSVGGKLSGVTILEVSLSVQEPGWDTVSERVSDNFS